MHRVVRSILLVAPAMLGATVLANAALAQQAESIQSNQNSASPLTRSTLEKVADYSNGEFTTVSGQVTSVSQLTDVRPTDWAFQALQSLVERYGCIVGYPDRTYRGNRALSRYEFAAGLNACLDRINELITAATADLVRKEDLLALQKLQEEFAAELAVLRGRVDQLEVRTATLEKQQFSTTTKLVGEVIFAVADTFGDRATRNGSDGFLSGINARNEDRLKDDQTEPIFVNRVRLNFDSSFTGKDTLRIRTQARNVTPFSGAFTGTNMTRLGFDGNNNNQVDVSKVYYRFPVGDNLRIQVDAVGNEFYNGLVSTLSPFASSGGGALSRFGRFNPVYRSNAAGAGFTFAYKFSSFLSLEGGYIADTNSNVPSPKDGLFNGAFTALGQVVIKPSKTFDVAFTYARSYFPGNEVNLTSSTGSGFAANPFGSTAILRRPTSSDTVSAQLQWKLSPQFILGGWFGYSWATQQNGNNDARLLNGAAFLAFPDLGKKGNLGGIIVGVPPKVIDNDIANREDNDTSIHLEALYRHRITPNIAITPGLIVILNPEHNSDNATQFVGVIRTTFSF
ncbi:carbohydrate porin [Leptothermofonsia sichuanensis E412]|uniref:iron uptake porin n=1 Tax=Leptothermofonsia sichuanensis TaxID=2917832 RepID=UPI001CA78A23|nr:iron uptake porin [Leptothermofonsia sichuanensis]QZZ21671.1 carbohydrate porin [Leptothermofonsia sichuanensis E412]